MSKSAPISLDEFGLGAARGFLESMRDPAIIVDAQEKVVQVNRSALALLTRPVERVEGFAVDGVFKVFLERVRRKHGLGSPTRLEQFYDNTWYVLQTFPLLAADGTTPTPYLVMTATDVSERKRREFDFLEIAAGLEEATRIAQMGTFKILWASRQIEWSPHNYTLHGVSPDTFTPGGDRYMSLVHPDDRDYVNRRGLGLARGEPAAGVEYRIIRPDGAERWMRLDGRVLFDSSGAGYASFGTMQDITDAKHREDELRELLRRNAILYEALEVSPNGVAVFINDEKGLDALYVNAAFERLTQHNSYSLNADSMRVLIPEQDVDAWRQIATAIDQSQGGEFDVTCRRRDGTDFPAKIEIAPVRDHPAQAAGAFVINLRDLTSENQRAAALLQSQKMEALGQLSGGVAHEINNLLQPIIALSDLGPNMIGINPDKARQYFGVISSSGLKAREVVRQVLMFARRDSPQLMSLNIVPLVTDAIDLAIKGLPAQIEVKSDICIDSAMALLSATQISQVVLNLLRNAADAMNGSGVIEVTLSRLQVDEGSSQAGLAAGPWIKFTVKDHGCGIDSVTLARVFEPFFTTKPVGRGTGLGLSVVYSIVDGWGGVIKLESEVDHGTTAVIYIPEQI